MSVHIAQACTHREPSAECQVSYTYMDRVDRIHIHIEWRVRCQKYVAASNLIEINVVQHDSFLFRWQNTNDTCVSVNITHEIRNILPAYSLTHSFDFHPYSSFGNTIQMYCIQSNISHM